MKQISGKAYAKINLYLDVRGLRADGYHELETVFQTVELCDLVAASLHRQGGISLRCSLPYLPTDGRNLAVKAAELFFRETGLENPGLNLNIKKNIPVGAGLAGGSTDAACVLRLLNRMFGMPLSGERLAAAALTLGADVPFCLRGGTALAGGVGEKLRPLPPLPECDVVLVKPGFSVSTKAAFALYDQTGGSRPGKSAPLLAALTRGDLKGVCRELHNGLEGPVAGQFPVIGQLKERLAELGAEGALMTGSGSAVYGIFSRREAAVQAAEALRGQLRFVAVTRPLAGL